MRRAPASKQRAKQAIMVEIFNKYKYRTDMTINNHQEAVQNEINLQSLDTLRLVTIRWRQQSAIFKIFRAAAAVAFPLFIILFLISKTEEADHCTYCYYLYRNTCSSVGAARNFLWTAIAKILMLCMFYDVIFMHDVHSDRLRPHLRSWTLYDWFWMSCASLFLRERRFLAADQTPT